MNETLIKVECPNGHRFPVNLEKHVDRNYCHCPKCKAKVQVRPSILKWSPNPDWSRIKAERESALKEEKERKKRTPGPAPTWVLGSNVKNAL